ncbi:MAG: hypothetical protein ACYTGO_10260 [Planctomycetota bacterium]
MDGGGPSRMFPVGFYGVLLASVFGLFLHRYLDTPESWLRTVVSLPLRAYSILLSPAPVHAAAETRPPAAATHTAMLRDELLRRLRHTALAGSRPPADFTVGGGAAYLPRVHAVLARRSGRAGLVDELVLAASHQDVLDSHPMVTAGDRLLGFLAWDAGDTGDTGAAVVRLLHHRPRVKPYRGRPGEAILIQAVPLPRRVPARIALSDQRALRCLVEPARPVEDWPLRCAQIEDPYLASCLRHSGQSVTTDHVPGDPQGALPSGLRIGTLKIWGYPEHDLPIGLYVQPSQAPEAVSAVVLWHRADAAGGTRGAGTRGQVVAAPIQGQPVRWMQLPAPTGPRWLVTAGSGVGLRPEAALVQDGVLLGTLQEPWSGQSLALPFASDNRPWSVLLLPKGNTGAIVQPSVLELVVRVVARSGPLLTLAVANSADLPAGALAAGHLFTGANGPHCPLGLLLGAVLPDGNRLLLQRPVQEIVRPLVYLGPEDHER